MQLGELKYSQGSNFLNQVTFLQYNFSYSENNKKNWETNFSVKIIIIHFFFLILASIRAIKIGRNKIYRSGDNIKSIKLIYEFSFFSIFTEWIFFYIRYRIYLITITTKEKMYYL